MVGGVYSKERAGVERFSLRQAVIFICATNRPDELDPEFVRSGRIDRRLFIGLPDSNSVLINLMFTALERS